MVSGPPRVALEANSFWADEHLQLTDDINTEIWNESPNEQRAIQCPTTLRLPGTVGAQQAMLDEPPLPWVPDVLGRQWQEADAIVIVGSAYAPFLQGISKRNATLPLTAYRTTRPDKFLPSFLEHVVRPDRDYYDRIALLAQDQGSAAGIALFDLSRASFTRRGTRVNGDLDRAAEFTFKPPKGCGPEEHRRAKESRQVFTKYVESTRQREWTRRRLEGSRATRIVALGYIAEHGLLKFFYDAGIRNITQRSKPSAPWSPSQDSAGTWVLRYAKPGRTLSQWLTDEDWWVITGNIGVQNRTWHLLPTLHPCCRKTADPTYERTRTLLKTMGEQRAF
jgi:hypothetical protein